MKRVLLTGGNGFIGRQVIPLLQKAGFDVHVAARSAGTEDAVTYHTLDLLDHAAVSVLIEAVKPTHVLHFAWIATPGVYQESPENMQWRDASVHMFHEAIEHGARRIVGAGSCFEYDWSDGLCVEGSTPLNASTLYGRCKNECREELENLVKEHGISSAWGRIFFLYGPGEPEKKLIASVIRSLLNGEKAECTHGTQIRDFLYVKDLASAFVALLESDVQGPVNIASGTSVTLGELVKNIGTMLDKEEDVILGAREAPANEPPEISASVERLQKEVGWTPAYTHEQGLEETIEWWRGQL